MKEPKEYIREAVQYLKNMDRATLAREFKEIVYHTNKQLFGQIPGVSAVAGILVGTWVASTFTNSPLKGFLSSWGLMKGGTHVVSTTTYRLLSVALPILVTALTAYLVQKGLKRYRQRRLERNMSYVAQMGKEVQDELRGKSSILNTAREAGLLSENEYQTKLANLYQTCSRNYHTKLEEIIIKKLEG